MIRKMKNDSNIQILIDRFFLGETSVEEEQKLYDFYVNHQDLPEDLEAYRTLIMGFGALSFQTSNQTSHKEQSLHISKQVSIRRRWLYACSGIAAALLLYAGITFVARQQQEKTLANIYAGSYVIINGQRIDDLSRIKPDIESALSEAKVIESQVSRKSAVTDAEQQILDNAGTEEERARIEQLLNE